MSHYNSDFLQINFGFPFQKLCNQMIETDGGNVYGYSENYQHALSSDIQFLGEETGLQEIKADSFWI